jgi:hypothetical protein
MRKLLPLAVVVTLVGTCGCSQEERTGRTGAEARLRKAVADGIPPAAAWANEQVSQDSFISSGVDWTSEDQWSACLAERKIVYGSIKDGRSYRDDFMSGYIPTGIREAKAMLVEEGNQATPVAWSWAWSTKEGYEDDRIDKAEHWFSLVHLPGADNWVISQASGIQNQQDGSSFYFQPGIISYLEPRSCLSKRPTLADRVKSLSGPVQ